MWSWNRIASVSDAENIMNSTSHAEDIADEVRDASPTASEGVGKGAMRAESHDDVAVRVVF